GFRARADPPRSGESRSSGPTPPPNGYEQPRVDRPTPPPPRPRAPPGAPPAAPEAKRRTRNRVLIGGVAIVGVAGLVGGGYLAYRALSAPDEVTAYCVKTENGQEVVVEDRYCQPGQAGFVDDDGRSSTGSLIILGGGPQYRYYYGGTNTVGKPPTGGTTVKPKSAQITTKSGTTIQRGGLGSKSTGGGGS
ncbi:hypothetical protein, partial [Nocardia farcinica]|uniref:hypothetical protein n=1 Tax=Nocardia farcinica TaxID=37329 RepID=UPI0024538A1D